MHDVVRLLTGSASDWLEDYFEHEAVKGFHASSSIIGSKVGPMSPGSGLVLLFHKMGEHDGHLGSWAFHKGGNGGFTQVLARAAEAFGAEIRLGSPVTSVLTQEGRAVGVALEDGTEFRAPVVVSALDPRRTFLDLVDPRELPADLVDNVERMKFRGVSAKVNFALDGLPGLPRPARHRRPLRRASSTSARPSSTSSAPSTPRSTAGTASGPSSTRRSSPSSTRTWLRPAST